MHFFKGLKMFLEIEKNSTSYSDMLDRTARSLEEIIKKTGSPSKVQ